jgi:membrane peptidoglycan carboxypeptidase
MSWNELLTRSLQARRLASEWLFKTRNSKAQDLRLRIRIERDAFARMTPYWRKLGFPFDELVPSYATAIGSSADRPLALAELMGIIVNDGLRRPTIDIRRLGFGMGTPYHTVFEQTPRTGERVMRTPIARLLRAVLAQVVEHGTARRVNHAFADDNGVPIRIGGKTGTGDNRIETFARGGRLLSSHVVSRTAGFVFYVGDRWFGVITASVSGPQAQEYTFTSSLPLAVLKLLAPMLDSAIRRECQCQLRD